MVVVRSKPGVSVNAAVLGLQQARLYPALSGYYRKNIKKRQLCCAFYSDLVKLDFLV